eukprot:TRINITY_DN122680_c0_g1_i1.p1 TRINITY_DN122680_c0_g1~~TRINITY_DN122680_c0_g1_i1.p1  ORF type:complete len:455 (+),score=165.82 TRINITY_DN122680_c0_g1_i1:98-1462(+)
MAGGALICLDSDDEAVVAVPKAPAKAAPAAPPAKAAAAGLPAKAAAAPAAENATKPRRRARAPAPPAAIIDIALTTSAPSKETLARRAARAEKRVAAAAKKAATSSGRKRNRPAKDADAILLEESSGSGSESSSSSSKSSDPVVESRRRKLTSGADVDTSEALDPKLFEQSEEGELHRQAQSMAEKALESLPPSARKKQLPKVKASILERLRKQAEDEAKGEKKEEGSPAGDAAAAAPPPPPPPPPEPEADVAEKPAATGPAAPTDAAARTGVSVAPGAKLLLKVSDPKAAGPPAEEEDDEKAAAAEREAVRAKRKALFANPERTKDDEDAAASAKPSANGWEHTTFSTSGDKVKFLKLLGGEKLAANVDSVAEEAAAGTLAENEAEDEELLLADNADCPVFEFSTGGDWVEQEHAAVDEAARQRAKHRQRERELERQFIQCKQRFGKEGLGTA